MIDRQALDAALIQSLAAEVRAQRARLGQTQEWAWTEAGISESSYKKIENAQAGVSRSIEQVSRLAYAFGLAPSELVRRVEDAAASLVASAPSPKVRQVKPTAKVSTQPTMPRRGKKSSRG